MRAGHLVTVQVVPLSLETTTAWSAPQPLLGRYAVPSGATLTWPCRPPQSSRLYVGTPAPKVVPPSRETAQKAVAMSWLQ